jgi:lipoteichoic acid synthase
MMRVWNWLQQHWRWFILPFVCGGLYFYEQNSAWNFYKTVSPFPEEEYWFRIVDSLLRDLILLIIAFILYFRRKRVPDRARRYEPVVVIGVLYLAFAAYMIHTLKMDRGTLTTFAVLAGLNNNILLVLLAAMFYHRTPTGIMKTLYLVVYMFSALIMFGDAVYFWQTSMHIQSILFRNFNIYAIQGVLTSFSWKFGLGFLVFVIALLFLFRVPEITRHKPNFVWSLMCVAAFTIVLNLVYNSSRQLNVVTYHAIGLWNEEQVEKSKNEYRDMLVTAIVPNMAEKAVFKKDKITRSAVVLKEKKLTDEDKHVLRKLGVLHREEPKPLKAPVYDRIIMLVLESVHRDFIHTYNPRIPKEATPFLDSLLQTYPHIDHYYSSAIPTTEGLNATFRSLFVFDGDIDGSKQPSLYRSLQDNGYDGYFFSASSQYYDNEFRTYPEQFGMAHYEGREQFEAQGYTGASGWGFHNDVMYDATLNKMLELKGSKYFMVTKTLDMHQPYPYYKTTWNDTPLSFRTDEIVTIHGMYWVDSTLKDFFFKAERDGLMDDKTLFIITSDHNPHSGGEYMQIVKNGADKQSIAPIPIIFVSKNLEALRQITPDTYASQVDLAPTLLCLEGIKPPARFFGRNLLQGYAEPECALGFFGDKAFYYSRDFSFVDKIDEPYPEHDYENSLANYIMYTYYESSLNK